MEGMSGKRVPTSIFGLLFPKWKKPASTIFGSEDRSEDGMEDVGGGRFISC